MYLKLLSLVLMLLPWLLVSMPSRQLFNLTTSLLLLLLVLMLLPL